MKDEQPQAVLEGLFPGLDPTVISLVLEDHNNDVDAAADALLVLQEDNIGSTAQPEAGALGLGNYADPRLRRSRSASGSAETTGWLEESIWGRGGRSWQRSQSSSAVGDSAGWLDDLASPLQGWASSISQTISDGMNAIAEEFSNWSTGASSGADEPHETRTQASDVGVKLPEAHHRRSSSHLSASSSRMSVPLGAGTHDYFQAPIHASDADHPKKDQ